MDTMSNIHDGLVYPYRVFGCGLRDSLTVILHIHLDDSQQFCGELAGGFRIFLHVSNELANLPDEFIHIPPDQGVNFNFRNFIFIIEFD